MAKKEQKNKDKIRVYFMDGKVDEIPGRLWDDYEVNYGMLIVKKNGAWIAGYNLKIVACFCVDVRNNK